LPRWPPLSIRQGFGAENRCQEIDVGEWTSPQALLPILNNQSVASGEVVVECGGPAFDEGEMDGRGKQTSGKTSIRATEDFSHKLAPGGAVLGACKNSSSAGPVAGRALHSVSVMSRDPDTEKFENTTSVELQCSLNIRRHASVPSIRTHRCCVRIGKRVDRSQRELSRGYPTRSGTGCVQDGFDRLRHRVDVEWRTLAKTLWQEAL